MFLNQPVYIGSLSTFIIEQLKISHMMATCMWERFYYNAKNIEAQARLWLQ